MVETQRTRTTSRSSTCPPALRDTLAAVSAAALDLLAAVSAAVLRDSANRARVKVKQTTISHHPHIQQHEHILTTLQHVPTKKLSFSLTLNLTNHLHPQPKTESNPQTLTCTRGEGSLAAAP